MRDALRSAPLFKDLPDADLDRLLEDATEDSCPGGAVLFEEGDPGDRACLILEGEVEVIKSTAGGEVRLARRGVGDVIGEIALIDDAPRMATVRAVTRTRVLSIRRSAMNELLETSPTAARALFSVLLERWRETEARLRQSERMAQIGTLTAGLAHEMNNPAAAISRASAQIAASHDRLLAAARAVDDDADDPTLVALLDQARQPPPPMSTLERSDRTASMEEILSAHGVAESWRLAPEIVRAGFEPDAVNALLDATSEGAAVAELIAATADTGELIRSIGEAATRLSAIVGALKSYTHLDRAQVQEVDLHRGIDDTLLILKGRLDGIDVQTEYSERALIAEVHAAEINQVWTNLIDNASDAAREASSPAITIRTLAEGDDAVVEVEDNGPGIPDDIRDRIFDAFFTTKPPGSGTGLGLDISRSIIVQHGGEISVDTEPGRTVFRVTLPLRRPEGT